MVIRTITRDFLVREGACRGGLALFDYLANGSDRITINFTGSGLKWLKERFANLRNDTNISFNYYVDYDDCYHHTLWLFARIAENSSELLQDLVNNGFDVDGWKVSHNTVLPNGYSRSPWGAIIPLGNYSTR